MFEALQSKLEGVFSQLGNKGRLTEEDVDKALREVRMALLEADVNFRVARDFVARIRERAVDEELLKSISPGQQVIKITNEVLTDILGGGVQRLEPGPQRPSVILMIGLNGSGKTTASAKLARYLKSDGQATMLVAADLHRPAAIQQLETLGSQIGAPVYQGGTKNSTAQVAKDGVKKAADTGAAWAIVDTAGRFQVDDELMVELEEVKAAVKPNEILLVVDAMTGQDAVQALCRWLGLADRIGLEQGDATATAYADGVFDKAFMLHVGMNIADKAALAAELHRVLKPGGTFGIYDVMRTGDGKLTYPVPWAMTAQGSAVDSPDDYKAALEAAGFRITAERNRRAFALDFFCPSASDRGKRSAASRSVHSHGRDGADESPQYDREHHRESRRAGRTDRKKIGVDRDQKRAPPLRVFPGLIEAD